MNFISCPSSSFLSEPCVAVSWAYARRAPGYTKPKTDQNFLWVAHTQHHVCVPGQNKNKANLRLHSNILAHGRAVV